MEDFTKVLELAREVWQSLQDKPARKIAANVLIVSSVLCLLCRIPALSSILGSMNETIRGWAFLAMMVSVLSICSTFLVDWIYDVADRRKAEKEARAREIEEEREHQEREAALEREREEEELKKAVKLRELGDRAKTVLKSVIRAGGTAWLPMDETGVLELIDSRVLKALYKGPAMDRQGQQCIAFCISPEMKSAVMKILPEWTTIPDNPKMLKYQ